MNPSYSEVFRNDERSCEPYLCVALAEAGPFAFQRFALTYEKGYKICDADWNIVLRGPFPGRWRQFLFHSMTLVERVRFLFRRIKTPSSLRGIAVSPALVAASKLTHLIPDDYWESCFEVEQEWRGYCHGQRVRLKEEDDGSLNFYEVFEQ